MSDPTRDVTPLPDLLHGRSARARSASAVRSMSTCCRRATPAARPGRTSRPGWRTCRRAGTSRRGASWSRDNPLPAIHGRVCYHPCESVCNRAHLDSAVSIHSVERFLGDLALERGWQFDPPPGPSGRRVLVVGAGPSGLSAAYHLARLGHEVEIRDAGDEPGGMMRYGIPAYRLPRDVLAGEIDRIAAIGVRITCGHRVEDLAAERREGGFDAVFVAVGAHLSKRVDIPARDAGRIVDAVSFLRSVASGERPVIGRRVAVYGGGNTAMDAARVARRLGADEALIVYRRTRGQMPAHARGGRGRRAGGCTDQLAAHDHGVRRPGAAGRGDGARPVRLAAADRPVRDARRGHRDPGARPGDRHRVPASGARSGVHRDGTVVVSTSLMTGCPGVFAGGDMVPSERTVTVGVGHGKKAARHIDA